MRTISRLFVCAQHRTKRSDSIAVWARDVVARPAAHGATQHEARIVADLLSRIEVTR